MADRSAQLRTLGDALASLMARIDEIQPGERIMGVYFGPYVNKMNGYCWMLELSSERKLQQPDRSPQPLTRQQVEIIREQNMAKIVAEYSRAVLEDSTPVTQVEDR